MRFFLDEEFLENGPEVPVDLVSIGLVCENGAEYYAQSTEYDASKASPWVVENVFSQLRTCMNDAPHLRHTEQCSLLYCPWRTRAQLRDEVLAFVRQQCQGEPPEFWAACGAYDWVVFCQLFGRMIDLPNEFPHYCHDLKQWCDVLGNPKLPVQAQGEHHALMDARHDKEVWEFLRAYASRM